MYYLLREKNSYSTSNFVLTAIPLTLDYLLIYGIATRDKYVANFNVICSANKPSK